MRVGQARKRDANEPAIVRALEQIGVKVQKVSAPGFCDLVVHHPHEGVLLLEVKAEKRGRLTPLQIAHWQDGWPVCIVRSVADALALFGVTQ